MVQKPRGVWRPCRNFRHLNNAIVDDHYPITSKRHMRRKSFMVVPSYAFQPQKHCPVIPEANRQLPSRKRQELLLNTLIISIMSSSSSQPMVLWSIDPNVSLELLSWLAFQSWDACGRAAGAGIAMHMADQTMADQSLSVASILSALHVTVIFITR